MKKLPPVFGQLSRSEVTQLTLMSGHRAHVKIQNAVQVADDSIWTSSQIVEVLLMAGGTQYVDKLKPEATRWRLRLEGIGVLTVWAIQQGDAIVAHFVPARDAANANKTSGAVQTAAADPQAASPKKPS